MGWLTFAACAYAAVRLLGGHSALGWVAAIVAVLNLWSFGVMANYRNERPSVDSAIQRTWITVNLLTSIAGVVLLIVSFAIKSR